VLEVGASLAITAALLIGIGDRYECEVVPVAIGRIFTVRAMVLRDEARHLRWWGAVGRESRGQTSPPCSSEAARRAGLSRPGRRTGRSPESFASMAVLSWSLSFDRCGADVSRKGPPGRVGGSRYPLDRVPPRTRRDARDNGRSPGRPRPSPAMTSRPPLRCRDTWSTPRPPSQHPLSPAGPCRDRAGSSRAGSASEDRRFARAKGLAVLRAFL